MLNFLKSILSFLFPPKKPEPVKVEPAPEVKPEPLPVPEVKAEPVPVPEVKPEPVPEKPFLNFPDISRYEPCDFKLFEVNDMITKATEGTTIVDPTLLTNMKGCKEKGVRLGVYHFFRVNKDPVEQAKFFIKTVGLENLKALYYEPIVDFETSTVGTKQTEADMRKAIPQLQIFMDYIEKETGRAPIFYSYESLIRYLELPSSFARYKLWIARYGKEPTSYLPWKQYWVWQYSDGSINNPKYPDSFKGIGRCDANVFWDKK